MYLFLDTISKESRFVAHDNKWNIIFEKSFDLLWNEYWKFFDSIVSFLNECVIELKQVEGITFINWPGWFTWTRIVSLVLNSIKFASSIQIQTLDYFSFLEMSWNSYPMIIKANRGEYMVKQEKESEPMILNISDIKDGIYSWIWDLKDFENANISVQCELSYEKFINKLRFIPKQGMADPFYIKKPNVT